MSKLSLKLDELRVESFETGEAGERGTVLAAQFAQLAKGYLADSGGASCPTCEPILTCTCAENGCGAAEPVVAEPVPVVRPPDTMYPGCTTVHTGCAETA